MKFLKPKTLQQGDTILLISTARARAPELIEPAISILKDWGLRIECGKNLYKKFNQFAGSDEERLEDLEWAIHHPVAKAVLMAGGGYGTLRVIDQVDFSQLKQYPKWFIGYSDATILLARLFKLGIECVHGPVAFQLYRNQATAVHLKDLLFGKWQEYKTTSHQLNRLGSGKGKIVGGNLSLIYALSGSKDEIVTSGNILFIEDIDEQLYHIDRMMLQLKRSGKLKDLAGLIVGGLTDMKDNAVPYGSTAEEIIYDAVKEYQYPVCFGFKAGHIDENYAFPIGADAKLEVNSAGSILTYDL
jgi:muramoyltetrapeptide carboxypeptidase